MIETASGNQVEVVVGTYAHAVKLVTVHFSFVRREYGAHSLLLWHDTLRGFLY